MKSSLFSRELVIQSMRGTPVTVEIAAQLTFRSDGTMLLVGSARDISGARLMRQNLKRSQALLSGLLNSMPDIIFFSDNNGEYLGCNRAFCELVGKSEDEIIGSTDYDLFPGEKARQYQAEDRYMLETGTAKRVEETLCYADGRKIEVETVISPYYSAEGEALGVVGVSRDITERRNMLRAIHERERRYHNLVEAMHDTIMRITPDGSFVFISPNFKRLTGFEPSQWLGKSIVDLMTGDDFSQLIADVARKAGVQAGTTALSEALFICEDGGRVEVELSISSEYEESGRLAGRVIVARNVHERRQIERALLMARDEAENANRSKTAFLASMSHELKTPLNSIMGYCQLLERRRGDSLDDKLLDYVRIIRENGLHLTSLIQDILDFSKLEADRCELEISEVVVGSLIDKVAAAMRPILEQNQQQLEPILASDAGVIIADERRLLQVLINLVGNAAKFSPVGSSIRLTANGDDHRIILTVSDEGPGIAPEYVDLVFEPFEQATLDPAVKNRGAGLGLSICRRLVEMHGGTIALQSIVGMGSHFFVLLPRQVDIEKQKNTPEAIVEEV